jgi:hypothetical protein
MGQPTIQSHFKPKLTENNNRESFPPTYLTVNTFNKEQSSPKSYMVNHLANQ